MRFWETKARSPVRSPVPRDFNLFFKKKYKLVYFTRICEIAPLCPHGPPRPRPDRGGAGGAESGADADVRYGLEEKLQFATNKLIKYFFHLVKVVAGLVELLSSNLVGNSGAQKKNKKSFLKKNSPTSSPSRSFRSNTL